MNEYYLRVSIEESETKLQQYHLFSTCEDDRESGEVLTSMIIETKERYNVKENAIRVEQFSKF
jgi:hypothetical protein